jgi:hypothetical protein
MFEIEHAIFTPAQLLRNWREQRSSNEGESVTEDVGGGSITRGGPAIFVP